MHNICRTMGYGFRKFIIVEIPMAIEKESPCFISNSDVGVE